MDAESFPYTDNNRQTTDRQQQTTTDRHARSDKGEAAYGVALKTLCMAELVKENHNA